MGFLSRLATTQRVGDTRSRLRCSLGQMFTPAHLLFLQDESTSLFFAELSIADVCFHGKHPLVLLLPLCSLSNPLLHQGNRAGLAEHLNKPKTDSCGC